MKKTAILLLLLTLFTKVFGFLRELVLSYFYGTSYIADIFIIAMTVPLVIFKFVTAGTGNAIIPLYSSIEKEKGTRVADEFTSNLTNIVILLSFVFTGLGILLAGPIVKIFAAGFEGEVFEKAVFFVRVIFLSLFAVGYGSIFTGYLQVKGNFKVPGSISIFLNIVIISAIIISSKLGFIALVVGVALANVFQYILYPFAVRKYGYRHKFFIDLKDPHIEETLKIIVPMIIGMAISDVNTIIDKTLASLVVSEGGVSSLNYAVKLYSFVAGLVVMSIGTVAYPEMSKAASENDMEKVKKTIRTTITLSAILVIPSIVAFLFFSNDVVRILFKRGMFTENDVTVVGGALFFYALGLIGYSLIDTLSKAFYSLKDTKTPVKNTGLIVLLNVIFSVSLSKFMGLNGLALGTAIASISGGISLSILFSKKHGKINFKLELVELVKITLASIVMGILTKIFFNFIQGFLSYKLSFIIMILFAGLVYFTLLLILKVTEVVDLFNKVKKA
ncbi:murein biosynthesis integral membrane protein MurJ [Citroniella saccharovorans]|uniref:Probable lipid II flippase MurJ n=1 Tax=Citroniella saccharovorans TaxID=2053367 RepID=A0AAW9MX56_9FIRM|nr:murein biosynthesis integral membrane protein MurJ [Citroniella saccharovorans]MEB3429089.1 murein biosynthesis integral membrane protein MurJ [Citroniella saccharovorans]